MSQFQTHILEPFIAGSRDRDRDRHLREQERLEQARIDEARRQHDDQARRYDKDRAARLLMNMSRENRLRMLDRAKQARGAASSRMTMLAGEGRLDSQTLAEMGGPESVDPDDLRQALSLQDARKHRQLLDEAQRAKMKADSAKKLGAVDAVFALHMRGDLPDEAFQPTLEAAIGGSDPVAAALRWKALAKPATAAKAPKEQSRVWQLNQKKGVLSDALVRGYRALKNADKIEDPDEQQAYRAQLQQHIDGLEEQLAAVGEEIIGSVNQAGSGGGPAPIAPRLALPTRQSGPMGPPAPKAPEGPGWFSRQLQGLGSMFGGGATEDQTTPAFIPSNGQNASVPITQAAPAPGGQYESFADRRAGSAGDTDTASMSLAAWYQGAREDPGVAVDRAVPMWMHAPQQSNQSHKMSDAQVREIAAWVGRMYPSAPTEHIGRMAYLLAKHYGWEVD